MNSTNPFPAYIEELNSKLYLQPGSSYLPQTYFISAVLAVLLILQLISLFIRWRKGTFWVFRLVRTQTGVFILPNGVVSWGLSSAIFLIVIQGFYSAMRLYGIPGSDLRGDMLWRTVIWIPLFLGLCCMTHGTLLAPVLSAPVGSANPSLLSRYPLLLNIWFFVVPVITLCTILPLSIQLNTIYNHTFELYLQLHDLLLLAENGALFDPVQLLGLQTLLKAKLPEVMDAWSRVFVAWYILVGFEIIVFTIAAIVHFKSLGTAIRNLRMKTSTGGMYSEEMQNLAWAFRSLIYSTICVLCVALSYFAFDIVLAVTVSHLYIPGGILPELLVLGVGYIYMIFGGIAIVVTFIRSFIPPPTSSASIISLHETGSKPQSKKNNTHRSSTLRGIGNRFIFAQTVEVETDDSHYGRKIPFEVDFGPASRTSSARDRDEEREGEMMDHKGPFM